MKSIYFLFCITLGPWCLSSFSLSAQEKQSVDLFPIGKALDKSQSSNLPQELKLADAIAKGIRMNPDLLQQKLTLRTNELFYEDARDQMYSPSIYLGINSNYATKFGKIHGPTAAPFPAAGFSALAFSSDWLFPTCGS